MSGIRDIVGGRSGSYEDSLMNARKAALDEMSQRASKLGANAIIGVSFQYSTVGAQKWHAYDYMQWYSCSSLIQKTPYKKY